MRYVVIHYNEISLKGKNQPLFIRQLEDNVLRATAGAGVRHAAHLSGRMVLRLAQDADLDTVRARLRDVFGIANFAVADRADLDMESLRSRVAGGLEGRRFGTFKVAARRANKGFPLTSEQINRDLGAFVQARTGAGVDLERPDLTIAVEVLPREMFVSFGREPGPGGLPVGVSGRVVGLLSGGIDSPVAAYRLMKRGCRVTFVHFHSVPFLDGTSREKAAALATVLTRFQFRSTLVLVPFGEIQRQVVVGAPAPLRVLLYRRFMGRIAERIARREGAKALVTGESLGQVASQTLENLAVTEEAVGIPLLRPLIGSDKEEIVQQARRIGTYEISIRPDQDCCRLFVPQHPATFASLEEIRAAEANLDLEQLVQLGLDGAEVETIDLPAGPEGREAPVRPASGAEDRADERTPLWSS
jgi:thiamine biosynthesis protein ThiI